MIKKISVTVILFLWIYSCTEKHEIINDYGIIPDGASAPFAIESEVNEDMVNALNEGQLGLTVISSDSSNYFIPMQIGQFNPRGKITVVVLAKGGQDGKVCKFVREDVPYDLRMRALVDSISNQVIVKENDNKILQYNYHIITENDVIRLPFEKIERQNVTKKDSFLTTENYAVPRSDYIHPLFGLDGEMLTRDWPEGRHPHHRGIFWAWPEVKFGSKLGDIYALQKVFARPTGKVELKSGPVYAQINAENLWLWKDTIPIVSENVGIRVYYADMKMRVIDLKLTFIALRDSISIARRGKITYGGLNLRMQFPESQDISYCSDSIGTDRKRSWSVFSGKFEENIDRSGLIVFQNQNNPQYPGEWIEYPDLAWVQPTFPASGTTYHLKKENPLILQYRLIIYKGDKPDKMKLDALWDSYHAPFAPLL